MAVSQKHPHRSFPERFIWEFLKPVSAEFLEDPRAIMNAHHIYIYIYTHTHSYIYIYNGNYYVYLGHVLLGGWGGGEVYSRGRPGRLALCHGLDDSLADVLPVHTFPPPGFEGIHPMPHCSIHLSYCPY